MMLCTFGVCVCVCVSGDEGSVAVGWVAGQDKRQWETPQNPIMPRPLPPTCVVQYLSFLPMLA